jgi:quercetin dioxygenase-like cupin family protein
MDRRLAMALPAALLMGAPANAQSMQISLNGMRPSAVAPAANFTGAVTVTPLFGPKPESNAAGGHVEFAPDSRSAWHTHPAGQTLIVTSGTGWVQQEGEEKIAIKPGDVIYTPPGVKHWHGATATNSMTHIAITPSVNGKNVDWMEQVTDEQYRR